MAGNNGFSFPATTTEFEFGVGLAPDSAAADRIFLNGKLTPHEFHSFPPKRSDSSSSSSKHSWRSSSIGSRSARSDNNAPRNNDGGQRRRRSSSSNLSSRQWQFIAGMPTLTLEHHAEAVSWRMSKSGSDSEEKAGSHKKKGLLRCFMSTCMECHALEPRKLGRGDFTLYWVD